VLLLLLLLLHLRASFLGSTEQQRLHKNGPQV
jgi:hypothetical protein